MTQAVQSSISTVLRIGADVVSVERRADLTSVPRIRIEVAADAFTRSITDVFVQADIDAIDHGVRGIVERLAQQYPALCLADAFDHQRSLQNVDDGHLADNHTDQLNFGNRRGHSDVSASSDASGDDAPIPFERVNTTSADEQ